MKKYQPIKEIQFVAKSGFITKAIWNDFFAHGSIGWRNKLWASFTQERIFLHHYSRVVSNVLVLNRKNKLVQKIVCEDLVSPPFVSQLNHDETLARIILELLRDGIVLKYRLEPELKKNAPGVKRHYSSAYKDKYPDALIQLNDSKRTRIAIELELTKKDPKRYRQIMNTYATFRNADSVLFIVHNERIPQTIKQAMRDCYYPKLERPVGFGRLEDWSLSPSTAEFRYDDKATSLREIMKSSTQTVA